VIPPMYDESDFPLRLRRLLALEVSRIVEDLEARRELLLEVWSRHRDRGPFVDTLHSRWRTLTMPDLATLDTEMVLHVEAFYRELDDLSLYFRFTQDMPTTLADAFDEGLLRLQAYGAMAIDALGGVPVRPLVEFAEDVDDDEIVVEADELRPADAGEE